MPELDKVHFATVSRYDFDQLQKDDDYFYFVLEDDGRYSLYVGDKLTSNAISIVEAFPPTGEAGRFFLQLSTGIIKIWMTEWVQVFPAEKGDTGKSAYQVWLDAGHEGTVEDFFNYLKGPQGAKGDTGLQGPQGPQGVPGPQGETGPTGATGEQGPTGPAGATGLQGPAGADGSTPTIDVTSVITLPAGTPAEARITGTSPDLHLELKIPQGAKGDKGEQGETGAPGPKGDTGPTGPQGPEGTVDYTQVQEYAEEAKAASEEAKQAAEEAKVIIESVSEAYIYGLLTDLDIAKTDANNASQKIVYDALNHINVPVETFAQEPCHNGRRCLLTFDADDNQILTYLNPSDSRYLSSGGAANLTGANGDVMVDIPAAWSHKYNYVDPATGHVMEVMLFSTQQFINSKPEPGTLFGSDDGKPLDQLVAAFMGSHCNSSGAVKALPHFGIPAAYAAGDKLRSVVGCRPYANVSGANARTMARNNKLYLIHSDTMKYIGELMAVHYGSYNIQSKFSKGFNFMQDNLYRNLRKNGRSVTLGNGSGELYAEDIIPSTITVSNVVFTRHAMSDEVVTADSKYGCAWKSDEDVVVFTETEEPSVGDTAYSNSTLATSAGTISAVSMGDLDYDLIGRWRSSAGSPKVAVCSFMGIEYPWGGGQWILGDGVLKYQNAVANDYSDSYILTCYDPSKFVTTFTHPAIPAGYVKEYVRMPKGSRYIANYDLMTKLAVVPEDDSEVFTGGSNRSLCDYWYNDANAGVRALSRGGTATHELIAGPFHVNANSTFSYAFTYISSRAATFKKK